MHGLVFTLGVLVSFWVLLGALLSLREKLESDFGWGFQLQEPVFVFGLAVFLFIFALSLSGVLEIECHLPGWEQNFRGQMAMAVLFSPGHWLRLWQLLVWHHF